MDDAVFQRAVTPDWPAPNVRELVRLWQAGKSAEQIAKHFRRRHPRITRNAVIGKIARMRCYGAPLRRGGA